MKPAVAYKNACRGGVCKDALHSALSQLEAQEESICKEEEQNLKFYSTLLFDLNSCMHDCFHKRGQLQSVNKYGVYIIQVKAEL